MLDDHKEKWHTCEKYNFLISVFKSEEGNTFYGSWIPANSSVLTHREPVTEKVPGVYTGSNGWYPAARKGGSPLAGTRPHPDTTWQTYRADL